MGGEPPGADRPRLSLIAAVAENGVIGRDGHLPWRLATDLARFKRLTMGRPLLMGRKTYESIGRPLPGRVSIVLTRDPSWNAGHPDVAVATTLDEAVRLAGAMERVRNDEAFVIGGGEIYRLALPAAERVLLTRVHAVVEGDATFPGLPASEWVCSDTTDHPAGERDDHPTTFETWERVAPAGA